MDTVNTFIQRVIRTAHAGKDMNIVAFSLQGGRQLGNVKGNAADMNRMDRLPRQKRDTHRMSPFY